MKIPVTKTMTQFNKATLPCEHCGKSHSAFSHISKDDAYYKAQNDVKACLEARIAAEQAVADSRERLDRFVEQVVYGSYVVSNGRRVKHATLEMVD